MGQSRAVTAIYVLGSIGSIVGASIAFQQGCWHSASTTPPPVAPPTVDPNPPAPQPSTSTETVAPEPPLSPEHEHGVATKIGVESDRPTHGQEFHPLEFSLSNGEQEVLLSGQASVGVEFNRVGEMDFVTVRINSPGKEPETHAALSTGARFDLAVGGKAYYVSILSVDKEARRVKLRLDRKGYS